MNKEFYYVRLPGDTQEEAFNDAGTLYDDIENAIEDCKEDGFDYFRIYDNNHELVFDSQE